MNIRFHLSSMKFTIMLCAGLMIFWLSGCKPESKTIDFKGKTIQFIQSNIINTADGQQIILNEDSIAKIYYLVRHAEKDTSVKDDAPLTPAGLARATKLADILRGTRIDAIYSTLTTRTMFTVDSLADIKSMQILPYDNKSLKDLIISLKESANYNRILIVGHSNTIPALTNSLAGRDIFSKIFEENEYDNFVIVVLKKSGPADVYTLKY